jgi:PPIC-type PPIASE domain
MLVLVGFMCWWGFMSWVVWLGCAAMAFWFSSWRACAACAACVAVAAGLVGCGGSGAGSDPARAAVDAGEPAAGGALQSGVVAYVGGRVISRSALESRMRMEAHLEPVSEDVVPVPPGFTACIAYVRAYAARSHTASESEGQVKGRCEALYQRLLDNAMQKFLRQTGENIPDLLYNEEQSVLSGAIREKILQSVPVVSAAQVAKDYAENKAQFAVAEQRNVEILKTGSAASARRLMREIRGGAGFAAVAKRPVSVRLPYAPNALIVGLERNAFREQSLNGAIFAAKPGVLVGPVRVDEPPGWEGRSPADIREIDGYYVFELQKVTPGYQEPFSQEREKIAKELALTRQREDVSTFVTAWRAKWRPRTNCLPGYVVSKCRQFKPTPGERPEDPYTLD